MNKSITNLSIGTRVRIIHRNDSIGTIISAVSVGSGLDGTDRIKVKWDRSDKETEWNPGFLFPVNTLAENDPDGLIIGKCKATKGHMTVDRYGTTIIVQPTFTRVE